MNDEEMTTEEIDAIMAGETPAVVPPPIIDEETPVAPEVPEEAPETPAETQQLSDEELEDYILREAERIRAKKEAPVEAAPAMPSVQIPEDMYDPDQRIIYAATEIAKQMVSEALAPLQEKMAQEEFQKAITTEAVEVAKQAGNDELSEIYQAAFAELGPQGMEAYKTNAVVKGFIDDAVKHRGQSMKPAVDEVPLPSKGLTAGGPTKGYSGEEREIAEGFDAAFAGIGLKYGDLDK